MVCGVIGQVDVMKAAASFRGSSGAGAIDRYPPHHL
jgi:hypothetical protein